MVTIAENQVWVHKTTGRTGTVIVVGHTWTELELDSEHTVDGNPTVIAVRTADLSDHYDLAWGA